MKNENCNCHKTEAITACLHNAWHCLCCDKHVAKPASHTHTNK